MINKQTDQGFCFLISKDHHTPLVCSNRLYQIQRTTEASEMSFDCKMFEYTRVMSIMYSTALIKEENDSSVSQYYTCFQMRVILCWGNLWPTSRCQEHAFKNRDHCTSSQTLYITGIQVLICSVYKRITVFGSGFFWLVGLKRFLCGERCASIYNKQRTHIARFFTLFSQWCFIRGSLKNDPI